MATPKKKSAPINPPPGERFWPARVAESLGITVKRVTVFRKTHLTTPAHYVTESNTLLLTTAGVARIKELLAAEATPTSPAAAPAAPQDVIPAGPPTRARMTVLRVTANRRLLLCARVDDPKKNPHLVRVTTNENFMPRMEFEAIESRDRLWQYTGRLPRRKGRF